MVSYRSLPVMHIFFLMSYNAINRTPSMPASHPQLSPRFGCYTFANTRHDFPSIFFTLGNLIAAGTVESNSWKKSNQISCVHSNLTLGSGVKVEMMPSNHILDPLDRMPNHLVWKSASSEPLWGSTFLLSILMSTGGPTNGSLHCYHRAHSFLGTRYCTEWIFWVQITFNCDSNLMW